MQDCAQKFTTFVHMLSDRFAFSGLSKAVLAAISKRSCRFLSLESGLHPGVLNCQQGNMIPWPCTWKTCKQRWLQYHSGYYYCIWSVQCIGLSCPDLQHAILSLPRSWQVLKRHGTVRSWQRTFVISWLLGRNCVWPVNETANGMLLLPPITCLIHVFSQLSIIQIPCLLASKPVNYNSL